MAFIDVIEPEDAEGDLAEFYEQAGAKRGSVANVLKVSSLHPALSEAHLDLYMALMYDRDAGLNRRRREMIAVAVSWANDCAYCLAHHRKAFEAYETDEMLVEELVTDPRTAGLEPNDRALVDYALALTKTPGAISEVHVDKLRAAGFDDADILNAAGVVGYFNFVNRLNLGLGAELEDEEQSYKY